MAIATWKTKSGQIRYQVKVKDHTGKWFPTRSYAKLAEAKEEEARLFQLKNKGNRVVTEDARTVIMDEYWEVWAVENRSEVGAGWRKSQDQMYRDYVRPIIGKATLASIGAPEIGRVLNRMAEQGRSDQMRKHVYSLLRKLFNDAVEYYEMIPVSPVKPKFHRPKVRQTKRDFLKPSEAWRLLEVSRDHFLGPAVWLQTLSGLRPGEVQALRGKCLLFDLNQILICATYNKKTKELQDFPKQEDWAYSPMPEVLKEYLLARRVGPLDFVAQGYSGGMLSYDTYYGGLKKLCKEAGVHSVTPHELRHTATELYVQAGASTEDIRRLLNHKSLNATKHYIHRTDERLARIASTLRDESVSNIVSNSGNLGKGLSLSEKRYLN